MTDGSENRQSGITPSVGHLGVTVKSYISQPLIGPRPPVKSDLLASLMSAMAMRILFLRKMSRRMMMTSMMARMITKEGEGSQR